MLVLVAAAIAVGSGVVVGVVIADPCLIDNCGHIRNAGDIPVIAAAADAPDETTTTSLIEPGDRSPVGEPWSAVRVDAGQCLRVEDGMFWSRAATVDRTASSEGQWVPIERWGARVDLKNGAC